MRGTFIPRLLIGLGVVFALFHSLALALESDRGQAGLIVAAAVVAATLAADCLLFGGSPDRVSRQLGLGVPAARGMLVAIGVSALLLAVIPAYLLLTGRAAAMYPGWVALLPGLFAQAGIAEEVLFRGYLFRHVRKGRSFRQAALVASGPFIVVHLLLENVVVFPFVWIAASATIPFLVFLVRPRTPFTAG